MVRPEGIEPPLPGPEPSALSTELRARCENYIMSKTNLPEFYELNRIILLKNSETICHRIFNQFPRTISSVATKGT